MLRFPAASHPLTLPPALTQHLPHRVWDSVCVFLPGVFPKTPHRVAFCETIYPEFGIGCRVAAATSIPAPVIQDNSTISSPELIEISCYFYLTI